ncbi:MAG: peptidoglycan DD-metalloendopeptidase family protein, partial [Clostridia bacterium]|nr:peptidoglycan DD-metalloendopeptidase family protein [Clostridia bacterium]
ELKSLAEQQLNSLTFQIEEAKASINDTESKIDSQEQAFLERMVQNYMEEDIDYLELVLGSENLVDFLTRMDRVNSILEYDKKVIADLTENREQLELVKAKLDEAEKTQMQRIAEYEEVIKSNQAIYQEKLDFIAYLESNKSAAQANYEYYKALDDQLNKELEDYLAELQRKSQSQYVGGNGGWPLEPGVYYYVSSEQGWRNLWGTQDFHYGIDLACANGTKILAYNAGTVLVSTFHYSYGNYVVVDHGGGISTLYAHMSSNAVSVGDYVQAGQLLGYCGLTGNTSGYHLHFEYRINGQVQNPRNYLVFP